MKHKRFSDEKIIGVLKEHGTSSVSPRSVQGFATSVTTGHELRYSGNFARGLLHQARDSVPIAGRWRHLGDTAHRQERHSNRCLVQVAARSQADTAWNVAIAERTARKASAPHANGDPRPHPPFHGQKPARRIMRRCRDRLLTAARMEAQAPAIRTARFPRAPADANTLKE